MSKSTTTPPPFTRYSSPPTEEVEVDKSSGASQERLTTLLALVSEVHLTVGQDEILSYPGAEDLEPDREVVEGITEAFLFCEKWSYFCEAELLKKYPGVDLSVCWQDGPSQCEIVDLMVQLDTTTVGSVFTVQDRDFLERQLLGDLAAAQEEWRKFVESGGLNLED